MSGRRITALAMLLPGTWALAQSLQWTQAAPASIVDSTGTVPLAGRLSTIVSVGTGAIAAGEGGVWLSKDAGAAWVPLSDGSWVTALAASGDGSAIYAANALGVSSSFDGGQTWGTPSSSGMPAGAVVERLALDPGNERHVLAALGGPAPALVGSGDGGETWSAVASLDVTDLAWSGSSVLAAARSALLFSSDDGASFAPLATLAGKTWVAVCAAAKGFEALAAGADADVLPIDAAGNLGTPGAVPQAAVAGTTAFALSCSGTSIWLGGAGIWLDANGGAPWSKIAGPSAGIGAIHALAMGVVGVWVASDTGAWQAATGSGLASANQGLLNAGVTGIALGAGGATVAMDALGVGAGGIQGGSAWAQIAAAPALSALTQAGSLYGLVAGSGVLAQSSDGGKTWTSAAAAAGYTALAGSTDGIWLGDGGGVVIAPGGPREQLPGGIVAIAADRSGAAAWAASGAEVWRTADGGQTWVQKSVLPEVPTAMAVDPVRENVIAAATADGEYVSVDGGASWLALSGGLGAAPCAALAFDSGETLWAGTLGRGLWELPLASASPAVQYVLPSTAPVASTVTLPIHIAAFGQPIRGAELDWSESEGGYVVQSGSAVSDAGGNAVVALQVPQQVGTVAVAVGVSGAGAGATVAQSFDATALGLAALAVISGANQQALAGQTLPQPIVIEAEDAYGNPVAGVAVGFTGGDFSAASVITGNDGLAKVAFTLPVQVGAVTLSASAAGGMRASWNEIGTGAPDYSLAITPPVNAVAPFQNASLLLQVAAVNGFNAAVSLRCIVPATGCSVAPASVLPGQSATVTVNGSAAGNQGSMMVEVEGDANHSAVATVLLQALGLTASGNALTLQAGASASLPLAVASINGLAGNVELGATMSDGSPLPATLAAEFQPSAIDLSASSAPMTVQFAVSAGSAARAAPWGRMTLELLFAALLAAEVRSRRGTAPRRRAWGIHRGRGGIRLVLVAGLALLMAGCGGAAGGVVAVVKGSAPAMRYGLVITASSNGLVASLPVTVTVVP